MQEDLIKKLNLLIIEDSEYDAELMVHLLRKHDIELDYDLISSAREMKEKLSQQVYDMVISDLNLPAFSGIEALKLVKSHDPMLPFILISGLITQEQELEVLQLGAEEVILKTNLNRLPFAVRRVIFEIADKRKMKKLITTKDKLISVLAHDIKGTLEGIVVLADFLQDDIGKESAVNSVRESLKLISRSASSTNQLLDNLLNWALMQLGTFKPKFNNLDLRNTLQESMDIYVSKAAGKNIELNLNVPSYTLSADRNMLSIVFRNLISNAIKFSNKESSIDIDFQEGEESVSIFFRDHGIGISDEMRKRLFDPDDRPNRQGTAQEESSGLGLLLCKDAVNLHGGTIVVESEENKGSTFIVKLPKEQQLVTSQLV